MCARSTDTRVFSSTESHQDLKVTAAIRCGKRAVRCEATGLVAAINERLRPACSNKCPHFDAYGQPQHAGRSRSGFGPAVREEGEELFGVAGQLRFCEAGDEVSQRHGLIDQEGVVGQEPGGHRCAEFGVAQHRPAERAAHGPDHCGFEALRVDLSTLPLPEHSGAVTDSGDGRLDAETTATALPSRMLTMSSPSPERGLSRIGHLRPRPARTRTGAANAVFRSCHSPSVS